MVAVKLFTLLLALLCSVMVAQARGVSQTGIAQADIAQTELNQIAALIFHNECASKDSCLTAWNEGEEFASLGIGHFIWYPVAVEQTFQESFPALLMFMQQHGAILPAWLNNDPQQANPWHNRTDFLAAYDSKNMRTLRDVLRRNKHLQAKFMQQRLRATLPKLLNGLEAELQAHVRSQFEYVAAAPMGMYVLMDYVNFKGEGTSLKERYHGKGWGMLQVLQHMSVENPGLLAVQAFADAADAMLAQRVQLSPPSRHEARWLPGWRKRLNTYVREAERRLQQAGMSFIGNTD